MKMISGEEFERRIRRVSQMRALGLGLRRAALQAWREGRCPYKPRIDIRSDVEYWLNQAKLRNSSNSSAIKRPEKQTQ